MPFKMATLRSLLLKRWNEFALQIHILHPYLLKLICVIPEGIMECPMDIDKINPYVYN